jgi:hypothetical protein
MIESATVQLNCCLFVATCLKWPAWTSRSQNSSALPYAEVVKSQIVAKGSEIVHAWPVSLFSGRANSEWSEAQFSAGEHVAICTFTWANSTQF